MMGGAAGPQALRPARRAEPSWLAVWLAAVVILALISLVAVARQRRRNTVFTNVAYGTADGQPLLLDIYTPARPGKRRPAILAIHGGGWTGGSKSSYAALAPRFTRAGYVMISVEYRLVKGNRNRWPAQIDDAQRAVRWVRAHAERYGIDPDRIGAYGHSAGGHLVAMLGTCDTRDDHDPLLAGYASRVSCVVDTCGPTDFRDDARRLFNPKIVPLVYGLIGKMPNEAPALYREASPITHIDAKTVPFLIFHGTADNVVPIDQSERLLTALQKSHVESRLVRLPGEGHLFTRRDDQERWMKETLAFFDAHLKGS